MALGEICASAPASIAATYAELVKRNLFVATAARAVWLHDESLWAVQQVALFLAHASRAKGLLGPGAANVSDLFPPSPPFISNYRFSSEDGYEADRERYGEDHPELIYSAPSEDLLRPPEELRDTARFAVFGQCGAARYRTASGAVDNLLAAVFGGIRDRARVTDARARRLAAGLVATASCGCAALLVLTLVPLLRFGMRVAEGGVAGQDCQGHGERDVCVHAAKVMAATLLCTVAGAAQFPLIVLPLQSDGAAAGTALNSTARLALAAGAIIDVATSLRTLERTRQHLDFCDGAARSGYNSIASLTSKQRGIMFDVSNGTSADTLLQEWMLTVRALVTAVPQVSLAPGYNPGNRTVRDSFLPTDDSVFSITVRAAWMEENYAALVSSLARSDAQYRAAAATHFRASLAPSAVFLGILCLGVLFAVARVLPWLVRILEQQDAETRTPRRAIPGVAIDAVPSVALFADSGVVSDEVAHAKPIAGYRISGGARAFIDAWRLHNIGEFSGPGLDRFCKRFLEAGSESPIGVVLSDGHGNIVFANSTALKWTRHDSLVGRNVGVLMPANVAAIHIQFFHRYMRVPATGEPRSIDMVANTSDGEPLHLIVKKDEAPSQDESVYVIAEMYRYPSADTAIRDDPQANVDTKSANTASAGPVLTTASPRQ